MHEKDLAPRGRDARERPERHMSLADYQDRRLDAVAHGGQGDVGDYLALLKPRVMSLVIFTALVGLLIAPGGIHPVLGAVAILCIAVGAGASGALNMWYDADIDAVMSRTARRPIPAGKVTPDEALAFGLVSAVHPFEDLLNAAHRLADRIAEQDPLALRLTKRLLAAPRSAHPLVDELAQAILFESGAKAERMDAFLNRSRSS